MSEVAPPSLRVDGVTLPCARRGVGKFHPAIASAHHEDSPVRDVVLGDFIPSLRVDGMHTVNNRNARRFLGGSSLHVGGMHTANN